MVLERIVAEGLHNSYMISSVKKEFTKAVNELWKEEPPMLRYQKKLLIDLAILEQEREGAVDLAQFEKLSGTDRLYSIRHPETPKNLRVIYTIYEESVILLCAFLEKNDSDYKRAIQRAQQRLSWLDN